MTGAKLKEFIRRLEAEGYTFSPKHSYIGTVHSSNGEYADLREDGDIMYQREYREFAFRVRDIRDEVNEYMTAYLAAAPFVERFPKGGKEDTRSLLIYAGYELAGRQTSDGNMDFVTWDIGNGYRNIGHYYESYAAAKEDFAVSCGLIDRRKLFTETELLLIRSGLAEIGDITPDRGVTEMTAIRSLVEKINDLVIPSLAEEEQEAEAQGYEPEIDM